MVSVKESQLRYTFITPFGRYCFTRGPFGLASMPKIFNRRIDEMIRGLDGMLKRMYDFLVGGSEEKEHDERLQKFLRVISANKVTLNSEMCRFRQNQVEFLGNFISLSGTKPLNEKVEVIQQFASPTYVTELRRFLGIAQQSSPFSSQLAHTAEALHGLLSSK